jgi:hypothetical protein
MCPKFWSENLKWRDLLEDLAIDGRIILEWMLNKQHGKMWAGFIFVKVSTSILITVRRSQIHTLIERWKCRWSYHKIIFHYEESKENRLRRNFSIKWIAIISSEWPLTRDSSILSAYVGGSFRQKKSCTDGALHNSWCSRIAFTKHCRPQIRPSRKLGSKLFPNQRFLGSINCIDGKSVLS